MKGLILPGLAPSYYSEVKDFVERNPYAVQRFQEAQKILGFSLLDAFKEATVHDNSVMECAYFVNTIALLDNALENDSFQPDVVISPSFGGMAAAVYLDSLAFDKALILTHESALISAHWFEQMEEHHTIFIYNLSVKDSEQIIEEYKKRGESLEIVGYIDKVIAICGRAPIIQELKNEINKKEKCIVIYTMYYPIHSKNLAMLKNEIKVNCFDKVDIKTPKIKVISDVTGKFIDNNHDLVEMLLDGYDNPVRWDLIEQQINNLSIEELHIVGPKNLFSQLLKNKYHTVSVNPHSVMSKQYGLERNKSYAYIHE